MRRNLGKIQKRINFNTNFKVVKRCRGKIDWLIFEVLIIRNKIPTLNIQADSIRAKLFFKLLVYSIFTPQIYCTYFWHFILLYIYHQFMLIFFAFDNDDMKSSKGRVTFLSLIFLLKCMSKSIVIVNIVCSFFSLSPSDCKVSIYHYLSITCKCPKVFFLNLILLQYHYRSGLWMTCHPCAKNEEVLPRLPNLNTDVENWYRFKTRKIDQSQRAYVLKDILNIVQNLLENQKIQN